MLIWEIAMPCGLIVFFSGRIDDTVLLAQNEFSLEESERSCSERREFEPALGTSLQWPGAAECRRTHPVDANDLPCESLHIGYEWCQRCCGTRLSALWKVRNPVRHNQGGQSARLQTARHQPKRRAPGCHRDGRVLDLCIAVGNVRSTGGLKTRGPRLCTRYLHGSLRPSGYHQSDRFAARLYRACAWSRSRSSPGRYR